MASISSARTSSRARRRSTSFAEKPQARSTRVAGVPPSDSTSTALPSLPLPRLAKRILENLVQLRVQQRDDSLRVGRCIDLTIGVDHSDLRHRVSLRTHVHHELAGRLRRAAGEKLAEQTFLLQLLHRVGETHVIQTLRAILVVDGEVAPVAYQSHTLPGTVERLANIHRGGAAPLCCAV